MEEFETVIFQKERSFKEFLPDTFLFLKTHWKSYFFYILLYAGPFFLAAGYYSSKAQIKIHETDNLFVMELFYAVLFDFIGEILLNGISFGYIISYITKNDTSRETIGSFFNQNIWLIIGATVFSNLFLSLGFVMFIIPGIILLAPLSMYVFDKLLYKQPMNITFSRCMQFSQTDIRLSYGIVLFLYVGIFIAKQLIGSLISIETPNFVGITVVLNVAMSVFFAFTSITISMLYFSLQSKYSKKIS